MSPRAKAPPIITSKEKRDAPPPRPPDAPAPIVPQAGFQKMFLGSRADVVIGGGVRGAGKSYALLMEPLRHTRHKDFGAVIFRRTYPEITNQGGLWDESQKLYSRCGAISKVGDLEWSFPDEAGRRGLGGRVRFAHMQHEQDAESWKGAQIPLIGIDQVEMFMEKQFWFLWSCNRSVMGVQPYMQCTCNPVPDDDPVGGWLRRLIDWWIDADGYAIPERSGVLRWFLRINEVLEWSSVTWSSRSPGTHDEAKRAAAVDFDERFPPDPGQSSRQPRSLTFIPGKLEDNPALTSKDPSYASRLEALPYVERMRFRHGNWNARPASGNVFNRAWFELVDVVPREARRGRGWDKAASENSGDESAGVKLAEYRGTWYVEHAVTGRWSSESRNVVMDQTAEFDGRACEIVIEVEPGSGGKESGEISARRLAGYPVHLVRVTGSKLTRARPFAAQVEARNVKVLHGSWTEKFIEECHRFTGADGGVDNEVDAASVIFNHMTLGGGGPLQIYGANTAPSGATADPLADRLRAFLGGG